MFKCVCVCQSRSFLLSAEARLCACGRICACACVILPVSACVRVSVCAVCVHLSLSGVCMFEPKVTACVSASVSESQYVRPACACLSCEFSSCISVVHCCTTRPLTTRVMETAILRHCFETCCEMMMQHRQSQTIADMQCFAPDYSSRVFSCCVCTVHAGAPCVCACYAYIA
jgi:hypothetical protein